MFLYHYFDKSTGPFISLSNVSVEEANAILNRIKKDKPNNQSAHRHPSYMEDRHYYEELIRMEFLKKGGIINIQSPHYMVVGHCPWLYTWYENCDFIKISIDEFDLKTVSFTYGDSHPVFSLRVNKMDDKEYRKKLYTYNEILNIIAKYGLPQEWNDDGQYGPERYIEAQIWSNETIEKYR